MTAPTIKRNAAKKPLISGRRPDMTTPVKQIEQLFHRARQIRKIAAKLARA